MNKQNSIQKATMLSTALLAVLSSTLISSCGGSGAAAPSPAPGTAPAEQGSPAGGQSKRSAAWVDDGLGSSSVDSNDENSRSASSAGFYMYFLDDINSTASNWRVSNGGGSGSFLVGTRLFANPSYGLYLQPYGNYENDYERSLDIPVYPVDPGGVLHLQFSSKYGLESGYDKLLVQVSTNSGSSYSTVKTLSGRNGHWPNWTKWTIEIPGNYSSYVKYYRVRFLVQSDDSITDWGFAFDKVRVYEARGFYIY